MKRTDLLTSLIVCVSGLILMIIALVDKDLTKLSLGAVWTVAGLYINLCGVVMELKQKVKKLEENP